MGAAANGAGPDQDQASAAYEEFFDSAGPSAAPAVENGGSNSGRPNLLESRTLTMNVMRAMAADVDGDDGERDITECLLPAKLSLIRADMFAQSCRIISLFF